jgi:translation initiation factor 2-alpha kinase 3
MGLQDLRLEDERNLNIDHQRALGHRRFSSVEEEINPYEFTLDAMVYIKMSLYPLALDHYLNNHNPQRKEFPRHCFHTDCSVRILLAILNGVEYLHEKRIIHRDLKPSNIFLSTRIAISSVQGDKNGEVNITSCAQCRAQVEADFGSKSVVDDKEYVFVTPHIGDLGLVKLLNPSSNRDDNEGSSSSSLYEVGTRFYYPKTLNQACEKLDVYSLGIIALELIACFNTRSERIKVLSTFRDTGMLPQQLEGHEMAYGIKHMNKENKDQRWGCSEVRIWLKNLRKKYKLVKEDE